MRLRSGDRIHNLGIRFSFWNANGRTGKSVTSNSNDVVLINKTHFNSPSHLRIFGYDLLTASHPFDRLRGGAAFLISSYLQYSPCRVFPQRSIHHLPPVERMVHKVLPFRKFPSWIPIQICRTILGDS